MTLGRECRAQSAVLSLPTDLVTTRRHPNRVSSCITPTTLPMPSSGRRSATVGLGTGVCAHLARPGHGHSLQSGAEATSLPRVPTSRRLSRSDRRQAAARCVPDFAPSPPRRAGHPTGVRGLALRCVRRVLASSITSGPPKRHRDGLEHTRSRPCRARRHRSGSPRSTRRRCRSPAAPGWVPTAEAANTPPDSTGSLGRASRVLHDTSAPR